MAGIEIIVYVCLQLRIPCLVYIHIQIKSYREVETSSPYGPKRYYDVEFNDGDELDDIAEEYVFCKTDYILLERKGFQSEWIGVRNETDTHDKWSRVVGWYVATVDGIEREFARLSRKFLRCSGLVCHIRYCISLSSQH